MQVELPDVETRATIGFERPMNDEEFFEFCATNRKLRIERYANGEIIIMPPAGFETGYRNNEVCRQLGNWARTDGRGIALDSNTEYILPSGAALSPDASWVQSSRLEQFSKEQKKRFLQLCPDFVVELISPTDRLGRVKTKMRDWIENGASLGWLIDADRRTVYIYRPMQDPKELVDVDHVLADGIVEGFRLDLTDIWRGL
jgi:Uma2 family endonuclease